MTEVLPLLMADTRHLNINRRPGTAPALKSGLSQANAQLNSKYSWTFQTH